MKSNRGLTLIALSITIIILLILAGISLTLVLGDNGVLTKATTVEVEYNKSEVLEELNFLITEKYLDAYSKATTEGKNNLEQYYTTEKVIKFLQGYTGGETGDDFSNQDTKVIIEELEGTSDSYFIRVSELKSDINAYGKGKNETGSNDIFYIKKESEEIYKVYYKNSNGVDEEIGDLQIQPKI